MGYREPEADEAEDVEPVGGGAILAIILLVLAVLLLLFLFREALGFGSPEVDIAIPEDIGVEAPPPTADAPQSDIMDNAIMDEAEAGAI